MKNLNERLVIFMKKVILVLLLAFSGASLYGCGSNDNSTSQAPNTTDTTQSADFDSKDQAKQDQTKQDQTNQNQTKQDQTKHNTNTSKNTTNQNKVNKSSNSNASVKPNDSKKNYKQT